MSESRWHRDPNWIGAKLDDTRVMLDVESGQYVGLNNTATVIWDALAEPITPAELQESLLARFDVSADQCAAAIERVLSEFEALGAIKVAA